MENLNRYVFTSRFVLEGNSLITYVSHDGDGDWQFSGNEPDIDTSDGRIVSLQEILEYDNSLSSIMNLPIGKRAIRDSLDQEWKVF